MTRAKHNRVGALLLIAAGAVPSRVFAAPPDARATAVELVAERGVVANAVSVRKSSAGSLVRVKPTLGGVPVVGADSSVRLDRNGEVVWSRVRALAERAPAVPVVAAADALAVAKNRLGPFSPEQTARHTRLVFLVHPTSPAPRLSWEVRFSDELLRRTYRGYVDADSGALLMLEDLTARASKHRAEVFDINPVADNDTVIEVVFDALPEDATHLDDGELEVVNCIDNRSCRQVKSIAGVRNVHYCDTVPMAQPGPDGSFLQHAPAIDTAPEDSFAEVQGYYHLRKSLEAFRKFAGDDSFGLDRKLITVVNHRLPDLSSEVSSCSGAGPGRADPSSRLSPEDNAYFWPAGDIGPTDLGDRILLSQGETADWAYDGEVVYHEFVHAAMHSMTPLSWFRHDSVGLDFSPGGLHEGFSDYFSATMTGRAKLVEYAGTTDAGPTFLGDLEKFHACPDSLVGEEHEESLAWSNALWMIRRSLRSQAKRDMFDRALFRVVASLRQFDGFPEASELVLVELDAEAEQFIVDNSLGASEAASLRDIVARAEDKLIERDLLECNGRLLPIAPGESKAELYAKGPIAAGFAQFGGQLMPAGMQFELTIDEDTTAIRVRSEETFAYDPQLKAADMPRAPDMKVLIKRDEPIEWRWNLPRGDHDAEQVVDFALDGDSEFAAAEGIVRGEFAAGTYYVQVANVGADWILTDVHMAIADDNGEFDDKSDDLGDRSSGGCSVRSPARGGAMLWVAVILLAGLRRRRVSSP